MCTRFWFTYQNLPAVFSVWYEWRFFNPYGRASCNTIKFFGLTPINICIWICLYDLSLQSFPVLFLFWIKACYRRISSLDFALKAHPKESRFHSGLLSMLACFYFYSWSGFLNLYSKIRCQSINPYLLTKRLSADLESINPIRLLVQAYSLTADSC